MPKNNTYLIRSGDGFVAEYNPDEKSCSWVTKHYNAHKFYSRHDAEAARIVLELPYSVIDEA